jgi:hypothetical protein
MQIKGYESIIAVELQGPDDLTGAALVGQIREYSCEDNYLGELSTGAGSITVTSTMQSGAEEGYEWVSTITLTFGGALTADWPEVTVMDIVRTDADPDQYLGFQIEIPWSTPVTRFET